MNRVKLFYVCIDDGVEVKEHQKEINKWLAKNEAFVINSIQSVISDEDMVTTIHYSEKTLSLS